MANAALAEMMQSMAKFQVQDGRTGKSPKGGQSTEQAQLRAAALSVLDALGGQSVQDDSVAFEGSRFVVPENFSGDYKSAAKFLLDIDKQENQSYTFGREYKYRWADGAAAFQRACKAVFGTSGLGKVTKGGFFSPDSPPELRSVEVDHGKTLQVPWGRVEMPPLECTFDLRATRDREYGILFYLEVTAPRRMRRRLEAFFDVVQRELEERSIYRGKAFNGADDPGFIDLSWVDSGKAVYSQETLAQIDANVWSVIRHTDEMRRLGLPVKRAVLFEGPYGTGKTLAGALTAQICRANGWTFIQVRPGVDDMLSALKTAQLYAPAVVQVEDIDVIASGEDDEQISQLLDSLDGIGNKGNGVMLIATTNHVRKIQKAVMRPGRLDAVITIGPLDEAAVERLIKATVSPEILGKVNYSETFTALAGFLPAFIVEALGRATRYSMARNGGIADKIETADIVHAANGLRTQLDLMNGANEGVKPKPTIDEAFHAMTREQINGTDTLDWDGDRNGSLAAARS